MKTLEKICIEDIFNSAGMFYEVPQNEHSRAAYARLKPQPIKPKDYVFLSCEFCKMEFLKGGSGLCVKMAHVKPKETAFDSYKIVKRIDGTLLLQGVKETDIPGYFYTIDIGILSEERTNYWLKNNGL